MLSEKRIVRYLHKRWSRIIKHLYAFSENKNPEDLHQLRVEIKKTKALFNLLQKSPNRVDFSGDLVAIKRIFRCAGKIRNAQINETLIDKYRLTNREYIKEQHKIIANESKVLYLETDMYAKIHRGLYHNILEKICSIKNKSILKLYKKRLKNLSHSFTGQSNQLTLHKNRKRIKRLIYMYTLVDNKLKRKLKIDILYLRDLETLIGNWHDSVVALELFSTANTNKQPTLKLKQQCKKKLGTIQTMVQDFSNKAQGVYY